MNHLPLLISNLADLVDDGIEPAEAVDGYLLDHEELLSMGDLVELASALGARTVGALRESLSDKVMDELERRRKRAIAASSAEACECGHSRETHSSGAAGPCRAFAGTCDCPAFLAEKRASR